MQIGFIGLGTMGRRMASHLIRAGHRLAVHDVLRSAADPLVLLGATWAASPAAAARGAEVVLTSLPGPSEVESVALAEGGVIASAASGTIYADLSTSSVRLIRQIYATGRLRGVEVLDAPVSGGPDGAQNATLQIMVGGDEPVFARAMPVLRALGDKVNPMCKLW
jgi:3-hydroxyisobutyrate dehydrogenase-like beta-hydroxyacid dehydrogenase